jgi:hypothetical protein
VAIKGPWDQLSYQPDVAGVVGDKLLEEGAKKLGGKSGGNVDSVLKGFLGGKK